MITEAVLEIVIEWFQKTKVAGLELPRGWFGRPLGNLHQLTWPAAREHKLLWELDRQLLLVLTEPAEAKTTPAELVIAGCARVTLDWQEYGSFKPHVEDHGAGPVRFVSPAALVRG